jgi:two-component system nitrogen regulation response regulator GlnG
MREKALLDISTLNRGRPKGSNLGAPGLIPALTVVSHPFLERVGDKLLLEALTAGRPIAISRGAPDFIRPGQRLGMPLSDPGLSRKPLTLGPGEQEGSVRIDPGESRQLVILLLHLADPLVNEAADALGMVGTSIGIHRVRSHIARVADLDVPVLIRGETGTGKELIAQAIHQRSSRRNRAFVSVNLGAITKELAASELFGSRKGAFTGAVKKAGFFQAAHGGTLFLDEVGEAPLEVQAMLLRVLETGEFFPVGEHAPVRVDVRLVTATDAPLEKLIQEGRFKEPLLHRLAGYKIQVPPLRERREDIGLLFHYFARKELAKLSEGDRQGPQPVNGEPWLPASLASRLLFYGWPGNIRQLHNLTRQVIIGSRGQPSLRLDPALEQELSGPMLPPTGLPAAIPLVTAAKPHRRKLSELSEEEIVRALEANAWQLKTAADQLNVARASLYDWLRQNPHVRTDNSLSVEELIRHYRECGEDLEVTSQRLRLSRWALVRRLKELGLLHEDP